MIEEAIRTRKSVRTFSNRDIANEEIIKINDYLNNKENLIGIHGNFIKIIIKKVEDNVDGKIGTYGIIKNPAYYAIAICKNNKSNMIDCGYVVEKFILFLQEKGIGTCWLGGTFDRKKLSINTDLKDDEFIPIVVPFGYPAESKAIADKIMSKISKSRTRMPFDELFFDTDFSHTIKDTKVRDTLEYVRVAPSAVNKQPWRIIMKDRKAHFYIKRNQNVGGKKIEYDIQVLDIGIAVAHYCAVTGKSTAYDANPNITILDENTEYVMSI